VATTSSERVAAALAQAEEELLFAPLAEALSASAGTDAFGFENIVGVGISERATANSLTGEQAISVYVERKVARAQLADVAVVPKAFEGIPTDVVECGELLAQTGKGRYRPAASGVSLSHYLGLAGTFGFVARKGSDLFVVSNNHVLARENEASKGDKILQPSPADGGGVDDELASLADWHPLSFAGDDNFVDAACALTQRELVSDEIYGVGRLAPTLMVSRRGLLVRKRGRTTSLTRGVVRDVDATIKLRYPRGVAILSQQTIVRGISTPFSESGDSGSLVFDEQSQAPVGLLCGGSRRFSVVNRIDHVLDVLGLSLVS
jgi:hypothetical protein